MKNFRLLLPVFFIIYMFSKSSYSSDISIKMITNNCNGCHVLNDVNNKVIPNIHNLDKDMFIKKMLEYKKSNSNSIMSRLSKVLSNDDISNLAKFYSTNEEE